MVSDFISQKSFSQPNLLVAHDLASSCFSRTKLSSTLFLKRSLKKSKLSLIVKETNNTICCSVNRRSDNLDEKVVLGVFRRHMFISAAICGVPLLTSSSKVFAEEAPFEDKFTSRSVAPEDDETPARVAPSHLKPVPASAPTSTSILKKYISRDYLFEYPPSFAKDEVSETYQPVSTVGTSPQLLYNDAVAPENPLKVRLIDPEGLTVSVAVRIASTMKPTFLQVNDISMFGEVAEVAQIVVPPGSTVTRFYSQDRVSPARKENPAKSAETGIVKKYYTYQFTRGNVIGVMCAAAKKGRVFVMLASCPKDQPDQVQKLTSITDTFKLR